MVLWVVGAFIVPPCPIIIIYYAKGKVGWKSLQWENFQSTIDLQKFQAYPIFMQGTPKLIKMQKKHNL